MWSRIHFRAEQILNVFYYFIPVFNYSLHSVACVMCEPGKYALSIYWEYCSSCPNEGVCEYGNLVPKPGKLKYNSIIAIFLWNIQVIGDLITILAKWLNVHHIQIVACFYNKIIIFQVFFLYKGRKWKFLYDRIWRANMSNMCSI